MVARATLAEVDVMRMSIKQAVEIYNRSILPAQRARDGYEGGYVLTTPEGKALVITFWRDHDAAEAGLASGFYGEQVEKFVTIFRSAPGRETYDVSVADLPAVAVG